MQPNFVTSTHETSADDIVQLLSLEPHPEGGLFRRTYLSEEKTAAGRPAHSAIYFLAIRDENRWHRIDAVEMFHWYAGSPVEIETWTETDGMKTLKLGNDFRSGMRPQVSVEKHVWQRMRANGDWGLLGCTVTPAFNYEGLEVAADGWTPMSQ